MPIHVFVSSYLLHSSPLRPSAHSSVAQGTARYAHMAQLRHPKARHVVSYRSPRVIAATGFCCFVALLCTACGNAGTPATQASTTTVAPTSTPIAACASVSTAPGTATTLSLPLPPHTESYSLPSAAGAGFFLECTPGATASSITVYLNTAFPQAGWRQWDPARDNAGGCGTQPNAYWQWSNGQVAVGWDFRSVTLPEWHITACSLAYGGITPSP